MSYGFHVPGSRGEFTLRAEFLYQWLVGHPPQPAASSGAPGGGGDDLRRAIAAGDEGAEGSGRPFGTRIGTLLVGYTVPF